MALLLAIGLLPLACGDWALSDIQGMYFALRRANVVDVAGPNLLMRIGSPLAYGLTGPVLSRSSLEQALRGAAGTLFPPGNAELVDVTLLTAEKRILDAEREGFGSGLVHWPLAGVTTEAFADACQSRNISCPSSLQPSHLPADERRRLAADFEEWNPDELDRRVLALRALLERPGSGGGARVVFFHCLGGIDRTGELFAAYAMRYLNMTLTQAMAENELVAGRVIAYPQQAAAQWYCENLRERGLYAHDDCGNCGPFRCRNTGHPLDPIFHYVLACLLAIGSTGLCGCAARRSCRKHRQPPKEDGGYYPMAA